MITYEAEGVKFPNIRKRETSNWIRNNQFLGHDYYTDIITFDYCDGKTINGDLMISLDTVFTNSDKFGRPYDEELHRVIIHGVLHLCGLNDKGPGERELMEAAENKALAML